MLLKELINKSVYGTIGYISSQDDLNLLEQYIIYNLSVLKEYKQVIIATNYKNYPELAEENTQLWKKYFPNCIILDSKLNRGHYIGYCDLDNIIFDYCKENHIKWLCKSANDVILQEQILNKEIEEADFYYLNGIGYAGLEDYNFNFETIINDLFYPQNNFYFINVFKIDGLNDKDHINDVYNKIIKNGGDIWKNGFGGCERLLRKCIEKNNLLKYNLVSLEKYYILLQVVKNYNIHDPSHKNIMI